MNGVARPRVVIFTPNPTQFGAPLYTYLSSTGRYDLKVYFTRTADTSSISDPELGHPPGWDAPLLEGYQYDVLSGPTLKRVARLVSLIRRGGNEAIIVSGWHSAIARAAILAGTMFHQPFAIHTDVTSLYRRPFWKSAIRAIALEPVLRRLPAFLATGSLARDHLLGMGIEADGIFLLPYALDNESIGASARAFERERIHHRQRLGIPDSAQVFLSVAKFVRREGVFDLLRAYSILKEDFPSAWLVLVGDGPLGAEMRAFAARADLNQVVFAGYQQYSLLPRFYAVCDAFVHPAHRESWGVSINEAMACGVPVISSDLVGAAHDLVHDGLTGFQYSGGNVDDLEAALRKFLVLSPQQRKTMGDAAQRAVIPWGYATVVSELDRLILFLGDSKDGEK